MVRAVGASTEYLSPNFTFYKGIHETLICNVGGCDDLQQLAKSLRIMDTAEEQGDGDSLVVDNSNNQLSLHRAGDYNTRYA